jgi:hypothetical protein
MSDRRPASSAPLVIATAVGVLALVPLAAQAPAAPTADPHRNRHPKALGPAQNGERPAPTYKVCG